VFFDSLPMKVAKNNKKRTERQSLFNSHRQSRWINSDLAFSYRLLAITLCDKNPYTNQ
jgi:hypothetical protein